METPGIDPLAASLADGDERAYAALYDRFGTRLYRTALGMLKRREDAEDTVQEVFWAVLRSRQRLLDVHDMTAYLFKTLRRLVGRCNARRARNAFDSDSEIHLVPARELSQDDAISPFGDRLQRALMALPAEQREVVVLKIHSELTFAQITDVLGVSMGTVTSRYRYALGKLRDVVEQSSVEK